MCCPATGSRRSTSARIPTAKVTSSPRWCAAASPTRRRPTRCCWCTGSPTTSSTPSRPTIRRPGLRLLRPGPAQVRAVMARGADAALHHRPGPLRHRTGARTGPHRGADRPMSRPSGSDGRCAHLRALHRRTDRPAVAGPGAAGAATSRRVASPAWCSTARGWICRARRSCAPPRRAPRSARSHASARSGWCARRRRAATAPPCTGSTAATSTTT